MMDPSLLRLVAVTDRRATGPDWIERVRLALEGGATAVWLREKDLTARQLFPFAQSLRALTRSFHAALIIADRADVALAVEAEAVHLGWTSLPVEAARAVVGSRCDIGVSCHSIEEVEAAVRGGADYLIVSPVFPTPSKEQWVAPVGLDGLREACSRFHLPIVALGGIDSGNAAACFQAGAAGIAAIRSILYASDVREAARRLSDSGRQPRL